MEKEYNTHLCTFMGREANLKILLPYIEDALRLEAVDNYWFIDMTRKPSDHKLIKKEQERLNKLFPGRVHIYNHKERSKIINDPEKIKEQSSSWGIFYKWLLNFKDNDVIAKCDDDTYFIDVETLKAAFELRWKNKKAFLMHANTINNGVTAYHQKKKGIWKDKESEMYPLGGLTGPLFSHPEVACEHHKQFTSDLIKDYGNLEKYKLNKNIYFCNRVSINFIFMLGSDRKILSQINLQDEYDTSSKYPQKTDRANLIIGDFTIAHHTYGVQEPVMEKKNTYEGYKKLCKSLHKKSRNLEHKPISNKVNSFSTIKFDNNYVMKSWVNANTYIIQNPEDQSYFSLKHVKMERKKPDPKGGDRPMIGLNRFFEKSQTAVSKEFKDAALFDLDLNSESQLLMTGTNNILKTTQQGDIRTMSFPIFYFFQASYQYHYAKIEKKDEGLYIIRSGKNPKSILGKKPVNKNLSPEKQSDARDFYFFDEDFKDFSWKIISMSSHSEEAILGKIHRPKNKLETDSTWAECLSDNLIPNYKIARDFYWMVTGYIWEFEEAGSENEFFIKLIADDKPDMYLSSEKDSLKVSNKKDKWVISGNFIEHSSSKKFLSLKDKNLCLSSKPFNLKFNIES